MGNLENNKHKFRTCYIFLKKYWVIIALVLIIYLGFQIRVSGFFDSNGYYKWDYLRNIDSYTYLREMTLIVKNGGIMPQCFYDRLAPIGDCRQEYMGPPRFPYHYIGSWSYMLIGSSFGLQLWEWLIYLPAILASLMAIPMYFLGRSLYDKRAGVLTALFVVIAPSIMLRTLGGDPDSDAVVMFLGMLALSSYFYTYSKIKDKLDKKVIALSVISGFLLAVFGFMWEHWYIFLVIFGFLITRSIISFVYYKKTRNSSGFKWLKLVWISFAIYFVSYVVFIAPFPGASSGTGAVTQLFSKPFEFSGLLSDGGGLKSEGVGFPNVYVSVAELQKGGIIMDMQTIIDVMQRSGFELFIAAIIGLVYCCASLVFRKRHLDIIILLVFWIGGTYFVSVFAVRFAILLTPALALGASIIFAKLFRVILKEDNNILD